MWHDGIITLCFAVSLYLLFLFSTLIEPMKKVKTDCFLTASTIAISHRYRTTYILVKEFELLMAKGGKRGGRVRDKWRDKQWVVVNSPLAFGGGPLSYVPITSSESTKGRVIENTMYDILRQDPTQHQTKVFVQIDKVQDGTATTIFKGHEYAKEFLRSLVRRGSSMISHVHDYTTVDGYTFRVVVVAFSQKRINSSRKHEIRMIAYKMLSEKIPKLTIDQFVQEATMGKMGADLLREAKNVASLRHIGIKKTKLISTPESKAVHQPKPTQSSAVLGPEELRQEVELNQ